MHAQPFAAGTGGAAGLPATGLVGRTGVAAIALGVPPALAGTVPAGMAGGGAHRLPNPLSAVAEDAEREEQGMDGDFDLLGPGGEEGRPALGSAGGRLIREASSWSDSSSNG